MKNGNFIGKIDKQPTLEQIDGVISLIKKTLSKYNFHVGQVNIDGKLDYVDWLLVGLVEPKNLKITIKIEDDKLPKVYRIKTTGTVIQRPTEFTFFLNCKDGYSSYERLMKNEEPDVFNQFSIMTRNNGAEKYYRNRYWHGYQPKHCYFYDDTIEGFEEDFDKYFGEIYSNIFLEGNRWLTKI